MPSTLNRPKKAAPALPAIPKEILDQFGPGLMTAEAIEAATMALKKALIERALGAELSHHLGYPPGAAKPQETPNQRNGKSGKTVLTKDGPLQIDVPRDRDGSFEPIHVDEHGPRCKGLDDLLVARTAGGMNARQRRAFGADRYRAAG